MKTMTAKAIRAHYNCPQADHVLSVNKKAKALPRARGQQQKYEFDVSLVSADEYDKMRRALYTVSYQAAIEDAGAELEELKDELQSWYDNLPDSFRDGEKGDALQECIDALEGIDISSIDLSEQGLADCTFVHVPPRQDKQRSRADRAAAVAGVLAELSDLLQTAADERRAAGYNQQAVQDLQDVASNLQDYADTLENTEFPGMY